MSEEPKTATSLPEAGPRAVSSSGARLSDPKTWVEAHGNYLFRYALIRVRNETVAEDLVQDTLLAAFQGQERFSGQSTERSWLTGILKHKVLDHFRRQARERTDHPDDLLPEELAGRFDDLGLWKHEPESGPTDSAIGAAGLGAKVALVEKHFMGGDCLNVGCVPSKAIIRAARAVASVREAADFGVNVPPGTTANFGQVMERMRRLRADISPHDSAQRFTELGVDVFLGAGKFTGPDTIEVGGQTLRFTKAVIATGARAAAPPIPGLKDVPYLTNETLFSLTELPKRLGIIGAGPIGCEMAQSFARFGSEVFLVEAEHGILPREDQDAAMIVREQMARDGVKLLCCGKDLKLAKDPNGVRLQVESHGKGYDVLVDQLLVAVGRAPNVEGLGLETAGVEFDKKGVKVNDRLQTANPRIYACGDICSPYQFTHAADFMARIVIQNALFKGRAKASSLIIPWATYTSPEIAHVSLYEKEAKDKGIEVDTFTQEMSKVDRAILDGETEGFVRVHVRKGTDEILGATVVAAHAGELIGELTLAMKGKLGLKTIGATIHPYPTQAEAIRKTGDLYNRTRLTPFVKKLMNRWLAWQR